jgi:hypothetical protein
MNDTYAKIRAYGVPHDLLRDLEDRIYAGLIDEWEQETRRIGHLLVAWGLDDIWRAVYCLHEPDAEPGDERAFLHEHPAGEAEP